VIREELNSKALKKIRRKVSSWNSGIKSRANSDFRVTIDWVLKFDNCEYCKCKLDPYIASLDHKLARSQGGMDNEANLVICCKKCNSAKGSISHQEFVYLLKLLSQPPFTERVKKLILAKLKLGWRADLQDRKPKQLF
jgi:5-methylcytosine-specific restriction endonuclease McrA